MRYATIIGLLLLLVAFPARGAGESETVVVWLLDITGENREVETADPFTLQRESIPLASLLRARDFVVPRNKPTMAKLKIEGKGLARRILELEIYRPTAEERQPDTYRFVGIDTSTPGKPKIKLVRFGRSFEPVIPAGPRTEWMLAMAKTFAPDQFVFAEFDMNERVPLLQSLDENRPVAHGRFVSTSDAEVDGKRYPGLRLMVEGKLQDFALPPGGGKVRSDDAIVQAAAKKLKKQSFVRMTLDPQRPGVIRSIGPDVSVVPIRENGVLFTSPGVRLRVEFARFGRPNLQVEPAPVTMADTYFQLALHQGRDKDVGDPVDVPHAAAREARELIGTFASSRLRDEAQAAEQQLRTVDTSTDAAIARILASLRDACERLSVSTADEVSTYYADARRIVGPEMTAALEKKGAELHAAGMMR